MSNSVLVAPYVRSFFEDHLTCRRNVSGNTLRSYRDALKLLLRFTAQRLQKSATQLQVTDFTETVVIGFLTDLEQTRGNSIQTRNHRLAALRGLFEYIAARDPLLLDYCRKIVAIPSKRGASLPEIRYLEKDQVTAILDTVDRNNPLGRRDYVLLLFMYNTGARVQEVVDVRISRLALSMPFKVELLGKGRKWRTCPLWENTAKHLRQLIEERKVKPGPDDYVFVNRFGHHLSRSGIADIVGRYAAKAVKSAPSFHGRRVTPHTLRHTTAMHLLRSGVEINVIRSWLGHVSIATTSHYIEIDLTAKAKALETCKVGPSDSATGSWQSNADILTWLESL